MLERCIDTSKKHKMLTLIENLGGYKVIKNITSIILLLILSACSNTPERETGEIKIVNMFSELINNKNKSNEFINARQLLTREQLDAVNVAVLYVELETG